MADEKKYSGFARMPRIIRKSYKHLTKLQKLLYIYLRDLCGESGVCYRSLRTLADETDFSIGYLSENIPILASEEVGLIKAHKQKRNNQKWEVWHIYIVDIWDLNTKFIESEKCSHDEQMEDQTGVHDVNSSHCEQIDSKSVHHVNQIEEKCSHGANKKEKDLNKNPSLLNKKESTPSLPSALIPLENLSQEERAFWDLWCSLDDIKPALNERAYGHVKELAPLVTTIEALKSLLDFSQKKIDATPTMTSKIAHLGNLKSYRKEWKRTYKPATSDKPASKEPLVLWTRTADPAIVEQFKHTRRSEVDKWEGLRDSIHWEWMTEAEALSHGWEVGRVFSDRERRELFAAQEANKKVLWTRYPDSPDFKIDPSVWYLFEDMPLSEAQKYNYDLFGGVPGDTQTRIRTNYDREARGEIKRPVLV